MRDAAKADPKRFGKLKAEMDRSGKVDGAYKKLKKAQRDDAVAEKAAGIPAISKRYRLVPRRATQLRGADRGRDLAVL